MRQIPSLVVVAWALLLALGLGALTRSLTAPEPEQERVQIPVAPFPYEERSAELRGAAGALAGVLTIPAGPGPFPGVLLVSGAGAQDRNAELAGHPRFLVLADHLARRGLAVLRLDDRGVGESAGDQLSATLEDLGDDVVRALDWLSRQPEIEADKVGLIGGSEGALVSGLAAARRPETAFVVLLSAPGLPGRSVLLEQQLRLARATGMAEADIERARGLLEESLGLFASRRPEEERRTRLREILQQLERLAPPGAGVAPSGARRELQIELALSPHMASLLGIDPAAFLRELQMPVLALSGSLDLQVEAASNLAAIEAALAEAGNPDFEVEEIAGLNHLLQPATTGLPAEYGEISTTYDPSVLRRVSDWILERTARKDSAP